jgi:hypothetical protein
VRCRCGGVCARCRVRDRIADAAACRQVSEGNLLKVHDQQAGSLLPPSGMRVAQAMPLAGEEVRPVRLFHPRLRR